jgi:hypothetical protein
MKQAAGVLATVAVIVLGILLLGDSFNGDDSTSEPTSSDAGSSPPSPEIVVAEPSTDDDSYFTRDEFDQLSQEEQDRMLEDFVLDFWEKELGLLETDAEEKNLSLEIFNRPYMLTLTEREYLQLSPEDREKADAEIGENCREIRSYVLDMVAEAESLVTDKDYLIAEAYLVHILEMGRELSANKVGMCLTRLVGISCENRALNGLVKLYTQTGDDSRVQMAREQMSENQKEIKEIAKEVQQSGANN